MHSNLHYMHLLIRLLTKFMIEKFQFITPFPISKNYSILPNNFFPWNEFAEKIRCRGIREDLAY